MKTRLLSAIGMFALALIVVASPAMAQESPTPSTNDANKANGWAYFTADTSEPGQVTLTFVSTRDWFVSCFEYRTDGDTTQAIGETNYNPEIGDGLYPYKCVSGATDTVTVSADEFVEVRMVFGAESDERFDWTSIPVTPVVNNPASKDDCKNGGYEAFGFSNQGQCIKFVNTGEDSRP